MKTTKKIVLLGHYGVGKTSVIRKYVTDAFSSDYKVTIGVHILKKEILLGNLNVSLILWDIEGPDDIERINSAYLLGSHAFVFTYDICRPATYKNLLDQIDGLKKKYPNTVHKIIGNKVDLIAQAQTDTKDYKSIFESTDYLTSAKTGENIESLFMDLAKELNS